MFKTTFGQDYLIITALVAIVVAALFAHTMIPFIAIAFGFIGGLVLPRVMLKKRWEGIELPKWKKYLIAGTVSLIFSQMGWVALLI